MSSCMRTLYHERSIPLDNVEFVKKITTQMVATPPIGRLM